MGGQSTENLVSKGFNEQKNSLTFWGGGMPFLTFHHINCDNSFLHCQHNNFVETQGLHILRSCTSQATLSNDLLLCTHFYHPLQKLGTGNCYRKEKRNYLTGSPLQFYSLYPTQGFPLLHRKQYKGKNKWLEGRRPVVPAFGQLLIKQSLKGTITRKFKVVHPTAKTQCCILCIVLVHLY